MTIVENPTCPIWETAKDNPFHSLAHCPARFKTKQTSFEASTMEKSRKATEIERNYFVDEQRK